MRMRITFYIEIGIIFGIEIGLRNMYRIKFETGIRFGINFRSGKIIRCKFRIRFRKYHYFLLASEIIICRIPTSIIIHKIIITIIIAITLIIIIIRTVITIIKMIK